MVVIEKIPRSKFEKGIGPKIEEVFGEQHISFLGLSSGFVVCCITAPEIPKSFLDQFGTGIDQLDEFIWKTQVRHTIAWICGEYRVVKTSYGERKVVVC